MQHETVEERGPACSASAAEFGVYSVVSVTAICSADSILYCMSSVGVSIERRYTITLRVADLSFLKGLHHNFFSAYSIRKS